MAENAEMDSAGLPVDDGALPLSDQERALMQAIGASGTTRRDFIRVLTAAGVSIPISDLLTGSRTRAADPAPERASDGHPAPGTSAVTLNVNGLSHRLTLDPRVTLLDALREHLHLTGTKKGCDQGQCGACTVIVDGRRIVSCLTLAVMHEGENITTIEGLGTPANLHPMQAAFVKHDGYQCGYCTPGQICSAVAMLDEIKAGIPSHAAVDVTAKPQLTPTELRERMSGNICRCGAYSNIAQAIIEVAGRGA